MAQKVIEGGLFITLEGGEGSGKTTQINRLAKNLNDLGYSVITTREPGGTPESEKIRNLLVQRDGGAWTPMAEVLLLFAARAMHIDKLIKPALQKGCIVISDRFTDSTVAYQGYGHGFDVQKIYDIAALSIDNFAPNLTFMLDIDTQKGLERSNKRLAAQKGFEQTEDRFERLDLSFHEKLRAGFLEIARNNPDCCHVLDAAQDIDFLATQMIALVRDKFGI